MKDYISISSDEGEASLTHHGVKGMKWGRRKDRRSSSGSSRKKTRTVKSTVSKKASNIQKKVNKAISKVDKEKVKKIAKTTAVIAGGVAVTAALGHFGLLGLQTVFYNGANAGASYQNMMDRMYGNYMGPIQDPTNGVWIRNSKKYSKLLK